ncbi:TlpA disulfide reductase family protein [Lacibacter luteus]|nr:TlpA disulfide reductase family protein [Lacibacter luteus]
MKSKLRLSALLLCALLLATATKAQTVKKGFVITGIVNGIDTGKVYLSHFLKDGTRVNDSTRLKSGKFAFKGAVKDADFYYLRMANDGLPLFVENSNISITANKGELRKAAVTGSETHIQFKEWSELWSAITSRAGEYYRLLATGKKDSTGNVTMQTDSVVRKAFDDGMAALTISTDSAINVMVSKYPSSPVTAYVIIDRYINYTDLPRVKKFFALLDSKGKNTSFGKQISEYLLIAAKTEPGATPTFAIADTSGKILKLSSLKGKYVLVDFWASWCVPCRRENPNVVKAYQKYHEKGFEIVGVSLDTKKDMWMKAIAKDGLNWYHVSDLKGWESGIVKELGVKVVPTSFLLDPNGKIIANNLRAELLWEKLAEIFN